MEIILIALISALLSVALTYVDGILTSIVPIALNAEQYMGTLTGQVGFVATFDLITNFGISLIVLKFLKKGFDMYVAWTDDANRDPLDLLVGFIKAITVAITFPIMYGWMAEIVSDLTNQLLATLSGSLDSNFSQSIMATASLNLFNAIICLVFFICFFFLYIQFLMRGLEIFILRVGMPIACTGLLEADKAGFKEYLKKFFQSTLSVVVQIALAKLSVGFMINGHMFWGIAGMVLALKTPRFLAEFVIVGSSVSPSINSVYHSAQMVKMAKSFIGK